MIDFTNALPVITQAKFFKISASTGCYKTRPASKDDLERRPRMDELHLGHPFSDNLSQCV